MAVTERREPQELQVTKYRRFSPLLSSVSGERQVLHVTYSTMTRLANAQKLDKDLITLTNIPSENVLDLLLLESTLDDQSSATIHGSTGTQLSEQELRNVLVRPLHPLTDVRNVGEDGLLVSFTEALWRWDLVALAAARGKVRMRVVQHDEES